MSESGNRSESWFESQRGIRTLSIALVSASALLVVVEFFYEHHHPHFELETFFGFQAWLGFAAFVIIVLAGRLLRPVLSQREDFYDRSLPTVDVTDRDRAGDDDHVE